MCFGGRTWRVTPEDAALHDRGWDGDSVEEDLVAGARLVPRAGHQDLDPALE